MARLRRRGATEELNPWPGYVDALSTLLMVIIFVLLVFVLAQAFLSVALTGRDRALDRLNRQVAELTDMLSLERGRSGDLQLTVNQLNADLSAATAVREGLARDLAALREEGSRVQADRDAVRADRDRLSARLADAQAQAEAAAARNQQLQSRVADTAGRTDAAGQQAAETAAQLAEARRQLAQTQAQAAEQDRVVQADKSTAEARLSDEQKLGESARAQVALLSRQVEELRAQMARLAAALSVAEASGRDKDTQLANLGSRLNAALASKVEELQRYRSEFFGRLREVLQGRPGVQVVGDRFVFQSEVLFPAGSADMTQAGQDQIRALAATLKDLAAKIPSDLNWILRVDGHADRQPVTRANFASNWELSAQRAINVVKLLVEDGVPARRLAATGFGEFQPLDRSEGAGSYARNRRIELRLTDR